jgi:hypothetical protein
MKQRLMTSSSSPSTSATHTSVSPKESKAMGTNSLGKPIAKAKKKGCIETDGVHQEKERQTILHTSTQVEFWMQTLQENRLRYWNNHEYIRRKQKEKNGSFSKIVPLFTSFQLLSPHHILSSPSL